MFLLTITITMVLKASVSLLSCRLRQHLDRTHGVAARGNTAKSMRELGKSIMCEHLHSQDEDSDIAFQGSSEEVSRDSN